MIAIRVRCAGTPFTVGPHRTRGLRVQRCGWTGEYTLAAPTPEDHCPICDGLVEEVPATTPIATAGPPPESETLRRAYLAVHEQLQIALGQLQAAQAENQQLRDLLIQSIKVTSYGSNGHCLYCKAHISEGDHSHCWWCGLRQEPAGELHLDGCRIADALEHHAALGQVIGYQTSDGRLYHPQDITIIHQAALGQVDQPTNSTTKGGDAVAQVSALRSGPALREQRLTQPATATSNMGAVAGPPPDLQQATFPAAHVLAHMAAEHQRAYDAPTGPLADVDAVQARANALLAGVVALEQLQAAHAEADIEGNPLPDEEDQAPLVDFQAPDLQQAIRAARAELAVLRHSNSLMRDLTREQDAALTEIRGQLQAAQAQVEQLRDLLAKYAEWAGVTTIDDGTGTQPTYYCPACRSSRKRGHKPNCPIQTALEQVERAKEHP